MKLGVLFSGGKDSTFALHRAMQKESVTCLISLFSENPESYMFHTPNIDLTILQAEAMGLPLVHKTTRGEKEDELRDLAAAMRQAMEQHHIEGIVTGAIESVYQAERVQRVCHALGLWCFNPLWKKDQEELLRELISCRFTVMISGVFAEPFDKSWLGGILDDKMLERLLRLRDDYHINPAGEGGEIETTVLDAPMFSRKIAIFEHEIRYDKRSGVYHVKRAGLVGK